MTHDEMIAIIQAAKEGKKIQVKSRNYYSGPKSGWADLKSGMIFNFAHYKYRVAPEVREYTVVLDASGAPIGVGPGRPGAYVMIKQSDSIAGMTTVRVREISND